MTNNMSGTKGPILGSVHIAGRSPTDDGNANPLPIAIFVDDSYSPPRLLIELPDRALRDLGIVTGVIGRVVADRRGDLCSG